MASHVLASEVKVRISHHNIKKPDNAISSTKELIFVLDALDDKPKKKNKGKKNSKEPTTSVKNFGANLNIPKVKNNEHLKTAWRCRVDAQSDGAKVLMPIRPVAILAGMLELDNQNFSLM